MNELTYSNRLEELYRILSEAEKRDLARFLSSPYFNRDASLTVFHQFLCKEQPDTTKYDKKAAWKFIFPKATYNEKKFRYMVSDLIASAEEFIYAQQILAAKRNYVHVLDEYYTLREADSNKSALGTKIINRKDAKRNIISPEYFLEQHFTNELVEELHSGSLKAYTKYVAEHRKESPGGLDVYYIIEKLRQLCLVANDNNVFGTKTRCFFENEVLQLASSKAFYENDFVRAYLSVYYLLTEKSEQQYFTLKEIIAKHGYDFEDKNLAELFTYTQNFCVGRVNAGRSDFFNELFDLYVQGLQKRVLLLNGEIHERNYKNIVTTALRTKKYDWTLDFINEYRYQLNKTVRENAYNYNLANYFFHARQYDNAIRNLQKVQLSDLFYGLDARSLTIKCYFELDEKEAFLNAYYSFRVFVQRRKNVSEQHRRNYLNFLRIAKKLMNLRPRDKAAIEKLKTDITTSKALADKNWLEEKLQAYL
jgi:hypothetical protein